MEFDHDKWISAEQNKSWNIRKNMAQDLVINQKLTAKTREETSKILGAAVVYSNIENNEMYYTIDLDYGWDIDPVKIEHLVVVLDSNDCVINTYRKITLNKLSG